MASIEAIPLPLVHPLAVNTWLLRGDPLTLVDTGPRNDEALAALEHGLWDRGLRPEDIELILLTHHHMDHVGLAETIRRRSGATIAALAGAAEYGARYDERVAGDRAYSNRLMAAHGVPAGIIADSESFWDFILANTESFRTDVYLTDGDRITAGSRDLRVVARPGHSTTDTLFVDDADRVALVGDHLLAGISSNTEIYPVGAERGRPSSRVEYLASLRRTAAMPLDRLFTGHGAPVTAHSELIRERLDEHRRQCERILAVLDNGPRTAFDLAAEFWSPRTVREQPLLVVWEVIGHLDLLAAAELVSEHVDDGGCHRFSAGGWTHEGLERMGLHVPGPRA
jgi:glyoxylase-like metal-dependent hydrolase (beta-lactamase superfamily II)